MAVMLHKAAKQVVIALGLVGLAALPTSSPAASSDLGMLTGLLAPANLMLMVGNVCASHDPSFLTETAGKRGDLRFYAQEVKDEVSQGISDDEVLLVLRQAADAARAGALKAIKSLRFYDSDTESRIMNSWCNTAVRSLVREYIRTHDERHAEFDQLLARAKARASPE